MKAVQKFVGNWVTKCWGTFSSGMNSVNRRTKRQS